jgi:hypothetical protein
VPNSEHYCVVVDRNGTPWEWYVREEENDIIITIIGESFESWEGEEESNYNTCSVLIQPVFVCANIHRVD